MTIHATPPVSPALAHITRVAWTIAATVLVFALFGCAAPKAASLPDGSLQVTITPARLAECKDQGGCGMVTSNELRELAEDAYNLGLDHGQQLANRKRGQL